MEKFIQCCNNTVLVSINSRKSGKKKVNNKTFSALPMPKLLPLPNNALKTEEIEPIINKVPKPRPKSEFDLDSTFNLDGFSTDSLKDLLKQVITHEHSILKTLKSRCVILDKLIKGTQNISSFTNKETSDFIKLIEEMTRTLIKTSEMEVELGLKNRLSERKNLENASLKYNNTVLSRRSQQSEYELKELREKLKILSEENLKLHKNNEVEKQKFSEVNNKVQLLEDSLWVITNSSTFSTQDSVTKLKSAITALLKDAHYYKKEIQAL